MKTAKLVFSYIWLIISNLVVLYVAFNVLGKPQTVFEKAVISLLILVYITILGLSRSFAFVFLGYGEGLSAEFKGIRKLMGEKDELTEEERQAKDELEMQKLHTVIKIWINSVFTWIIYVVIGFTLLSL